MEIYIRKEKSTDYKAVFNLIEKAFKKEQFSDNREQYLVERLRKSTAFIPELSLVAIINNEIVGHILLTKIKIKNKYNKFESLALAPVSVLPKYQNKGIGGMLIIKAHNIAKELGFQSIVLLGHKDYYPRFGYVQADQFGIQLPFDAPKENCMAIELKRNSFQNVMGMVEYPKEFYE